MSSPTVPALEQWPPDPIHDVSADDTRWTSANAGEQMPGLLTPLTARYVVGPAELGVRMAFHDLGVLPRSEVRPATSADKQHVAMFFGRFTTNVDEVRRIFDLTPGASGEAYEQQMFGSLKPGVTHALAKRRYPVVAVRMPLAMALVGRRSRALRKDFQQWWQGAVREAETASLEDCRRLFGEAQDRMAQLLRFHWVATMAAQVSYGKIAALAAGAGKPGLETTICGGYGTEEVQVAIDFWRLAHGEITHEDFLLEHGHNVPSGAELSARSWREDPASIDDLLGSYRRLSADQNPAEVIKRRAGERQAAQAAILAALPRHRRPGAALLFRLSREYIQLRTVGKGAQHVSYDVARAAARRAGQLLAQDGVLHEPDDVFYLTDKELLGALPGDAGSIAVARKARRATYASLELPQTWIGNPVPLEAGPDEAATAAGPVSGMGVSPGVVEGVVRIVESPMDGDLEPGEILVCETTDPSWISLMVVAAGLVIDIGGPVSHGAIVAREMGVPCVINTQDGTRRLRTGERVRIDGSAGTVEVLVAA